MLVQIIKSTILTICLVVFPTLNFAANTPSKMKSIKLTYGAHIISAEIARTNEEQSRGLMWRDKLAADHGMLFIFAEDSIHCMWMKNTLIPLSVAFLDAQGEIINIENMQPLSEQTHCSLKAAKYALEMNINWFFNKATLGRNIQSISGLPQ